MKRVIVQTAKTTNKNPCNLFFYCNLCLSRKIFNQTPFTKMYNLAKTALSLLLHALKFYTVFTCFGSDGLASVSPTSCSAFCTLFCSLVFYVAAHRVILQEDWLLISCCCCCLHFKGHRSVQCCVRRCCTHETHHRLYKIRLFWFDWYKPRQ